MHLPRRPLAVFTAISLLALASVLSGRGTGVTPGVLQVPIDLTQNYPGCGQFMCHAPFPNSGGLVRMAISTSTTSIDFGGQITGSAQATGGVANPGTLGGFCLETMAGSFTAGTACQLGRDMLFNPVPTILTHTSYNSRSWSFTFRAPLTAGPLHWFGAINTVNGDGQPTGDSWDWWQPGNLNSTPGIPFRLYVNAPSVQAFGSACPGSRGLAPVIGAPVAPAVGAANFSVDVINVPNGAVVLSILGTSDQSYAGVPLPLDLAILQAPGCFLRTSLVLIQAGVATGGSPTVPGSGVASVVWPIPADPSLRGGTLYFQDLVVDPAANPGGLTASAGLRVTVQ
jgi:hypothetical protein